MSDGQVILGCLEILGVLSLLAGAVLLLNLLARDAISRCRVVWRSGRLSLKDQDQ